MKTRFHTKKAEKTAIKRQKIMDAYFAAMKKEVVSLYADGTEVLNKALSDG